MRGSWASACADARDPTGYDRVLAGERAQLLLTDPPYCLLTRRRRGGEERQPKGRKIERGPVMRFESVRAYRAFTQAWLPLAVAHLVPGAPLVIWTNFLGKEPIRQVAAGCGYGHLGGEFAWAKATQPGDGSERLLRVYEVALVFWQAAQPAPAPGDLPKPWSVVTGYDEEGSAARWGHHPNHKPFGVLEPLVRAYSRPGQRVLDPFAGSGSIPAAAVLLERRAACLEIDAEWAARVEARLIDSLDSPRDWRAQRRG
jgi:site-specific DNA-methyltransferase (adenine-specific)